MSTVRTALACQQGINTNFICTENGKQATVIKQCSLIAEATKSLIQCNVTVMKEMNSQAIASVAKAASNQPGVRTMLVWNYGVRQTTSFNDFSIEAGTLLSLLRKLWCHVWLGQTMQTVRSNCVHDKLSPSRFKYNSTQLGLVRRSFELVSDGRSKKHRANWELTDGQLLCYKVARCERCQYSCTQWSGCQDCSSSLRWLYHYFIFINTAADIPTSGVRANVRANDQKNNTS